MILTAIVVLSTTLTGNTCAAIDNRTNTAVWAMKSRYGVSYGRTHYGDYGDNLGYDAPIPRPVWPTLNKVERHLRSTPPGPKTFVQCDARR